MLRTKLSNFKYFNGDQTINIQFKVELCKNQRG